MFQYYNWEEVEINWEALNLNWEEIGFLINDVLPNVGFPPFGGGGATRHNLEELNKLSEEKKRRIIKIVYNFTGDDEYIDYKYKNDKNIKITAKDINIIVEELLKNKIKVDVQIIS